jgi:hypothetical protein
MHTSQPVHPSGWTMATKGDFFFFLTAAGAAAGATGRGVGVCVIHSLLVCRNWSSSPSPHGREYSKGSYLCQEQRGFLPQHVHTMAERSLHGADKVIQSSLDYAGEFFTILVVARNLIPPCTSGSKVVYWRARCLCVPVEPNPNKYAHMKTE